MRQWSNRNPVEIREIEYVDLPCRVEIVGACALVKGRVEICKGGEPLRVKGLIRYLLKLKA